MYIYIYISVNSKKIKYLHLLFSPRKVSLMRKLKMYIFPIYFQIATFLKTGEYTYIYVYYIYYVKKLLRIKRSDKIT